MTTVVPFPISSFSDRGKCIALFVALSLLPQLAEAQDSIIRQGAPDLEISTEIPDPPDVPDVHRAPRRLRVVPTTRGLDLNEGKFSMPISRVGIKLDKSTGVLTLKGNAGKNVARVTESQPGKIRAEIGLQVETYDKSTIKEIIFEGGDGDDDFRNSTSIKCTAHGGDGDDILGGGSSDDFLVGGLGRDTIHGNGGDDVIWGSGGSDFLWGDDGNDEIFGHGGNDEIHGGGGRDLLNGGSGNDLLFGDGGQDLLVSVGLGKDTITGGAQWDNFWVDSADSITDASSNENALGYVHIISGFRGISYSGGNTLTPIGLEPAGEDIPDPLLDPKHAGLVLKNFADHPLFAESGPSKDDIFQGSVGDCYFVAKLSALAGAEPEWVRKSVAPLGDGSYAVRLYREDKGDYKEDYFRVDADLWVDTAGTPKYARLGQEGAIWVPLIEKAFAIGRRDLGNYKSIAGGNGLTLSTIKYTTTPWHIDDGVKPEEIVSWVNNGMPKGATKTAVEKGVTDLLVWIHQQVEAEKPLYTGAISSISDSTAIQLDDPATDASESTYRRGQHVYQVDHVKFDSEGKPKGLVLRDPYGTYRTITDFARIYFCIGRASVLEVK